MSEFESLGLKGGIWHGLLHRATPPARLVLVHMGARVGEARLDPEGEGVWRVSAAIPAERLSDGVQSFLLLEDQGEEGEPPRPGALHLGSLTLVAGALLDDDLRAELDLMRAELELLKKELRRLAARAEAG
ncbi:hypothetical protein [Paracoccus binzhouensis]|uniref:hypothetical protein n=1 Tax=Paracoccus binzhouensis TaxID=2796149 RepID=UPI0018EEE227|nr:hypothetical protein [Paracoccus binzhouensis]